MQTSLLQPIDLPLSQTWFHPAAAASAATAGSSRPPLHQHHYQQQYLPFQSPYQSPYPFAYQSAYPYTSYALHQSPSKAAPLQPATRLQQPFIFGLPPHPVPDRHAVPELEPASSPSEPGSPMSTLAPPTPNPESVHVVCNAPLLAPKPLPYRPPAFLNTFDLPDPDADLSRPPYTNSAAARSKRKRSGDSDDVSAGEDSAESTPVGKRRATEAAWRGRVPTGTLNGVASQRRYSS